MRARTPIRIINGVVFAWLKAPPKEQKGCQKGFPLYKLGRPKKGKQVLSFPRPTGATQDLSRPI